MGIKKSIIILALLCAAACNRPRDADSDTATAALAPPTGCASPFIDSAALFTVSFNTHGGRPDTISPVTVLSCGEALGERMPASPTMDGYVFSGWFDRPTGIMDDTEYTASTIITHDVTLLARWAWHPVPKVQFNPSVAYSYFTDARDRKRYRKVTIGAHTWMAENLNYKTGKSWCYDNKKYNCAVYGRLYDWNTAMKACPSGWHLPDSKEWLLAIKHIGNYSDVDKKLISKIGWNDYTRVGDNVTDEYGFSALPGGLRGKSYNGVPGYDGIGYHGMWWSATDWRMKLGSDSPDDADVWDISYYGGVSNYGGSETDAGLSVRCVEGPAPPAPKPQIAAPEPLSSFTDERDGLGYKSVKIGDDVWMAENLNYKTDSSWCHENDESKCKIYGRLYIWEAATKACPSGWHLPDTAEWNRLESAVGRFLSAEKLKSKTGWYESDDINRNGTDTHGFSALPGGERLNSFGIHAVFTPLGYGFWWSATDDYGGGTAYYRQITYESNVGHICGPKSNGLSVRCVRDKP